MPRERQVYLLDPQDLPPETIAVTFAKTSRSPQSFRQIAAELTAARSADFHEKWVVGYGHASVAEHAVLHIAVENLSRLAVESLESNRLASYTEKSTRYQQWGPDDFFIPPELDHHLLRERFVDTCRDLFDTYTRCLDPVLAAVKRETPRDPEETEDAWLRRVRPQGVDVCRFLLPAAALANVGMTINARALEHAISKMLSHPLAEVRAIGTEIKTAARQSIPTLVKYADAVAYLQSAGERLTAQSAATSQSLEVLDPGDTPWCRLVHFDADAEIRILAAALYRFGRQPYAQALAAVQAMPPAGRIQLAQAVLADLGPHDTPLRELEYAAFTFDVILDQGAYAELKRHRMMTQTPQALTAALGYALPRRFVAAGVADDVCRALDSAHQTWAALAGFNPALASYIVPNGFNRRVLINTNLRSLMHFLALRTAPNAHFSIRRVARRMAELVQQAAPLLGAYLHIHPGETWQQVEQDHFETTA
ncbi:MAG TPA: FAD-dependent thymidylate synthase [Anaerolineaceae bacterium]|nr:FAD-dependent thymidylate synthase [Anaerolineaceae bacterium]